MSNSIVVYEPHIVIRLYSGKEIIVPERMRGEIEKQMDIKKFIRIQDITFAVSAVEHIDKVDTNKGDLENAKENEKKMVENLIATLEPNTRIKIREMVMTWKEENKTKILKEGHVRNMIESLTSKEK